MFKTPNKYVNPLLWAFLGWTVSIVGHELAEHFIRHGHLLILVHVDEVFVGLAIGFLRFFQSEYQVEQIYATRDLEHKVRSALQVLLCSDDQPKRSKALSEILTALEDYRPMRPDFAVELVKQSRQKPVDTPPA